MSEEITNTENEFVEVTENAELTTEAKSPNALLKAQEIALNAVMDQTERTAEFLKNTYKIDEHNPAAGLIDAAQAGVERMTEFQKDLAHRASDRIESMIERRKESKAAAEEAKAEKTSHALPMRELSENGINMLLDDQEELVNLGHKQTRLFLDSLEELSKNKGKGLVKGFAKYSGQAFKNIVDAQDRILDINKDYLRANRELLQQNEERETVNRLTGFAFDRANDAIDTSKQLLDLTNSFSKDKAEEESVDAEHGALYDLASNGIERITRRQKDNLAFSREVVGKVFAR